MRLRVLVTRFLHEKTITPIGELQLQADDGVLLAALCCLPLLEFGAVGLEGWSQLIVYPDAFRVHRSHMDAAGVLHEWDDELIGESWDSGPLILSWADVQADLAAPHEGYCVAVHEMVHKLDALDGAMDGTPPLPRAWQREWAATFQRAYDAFCAQVDAGQETLIDPYAAEAPEEFFAVASEYHFSAPDLLQQALPGWPRSCGGSTASRPGSQYGSSGRWPAPSCSSMAWLDCRPAAGTTDQRGLRPCGQAHFEAGAAQFGRTAHGQFAAVILIRSCTIDSPMPWPCTRSSPRTPRCSTLPMSSGAMPGPSSSTASSRPARRAFGAGSGCAVSSTRRLAHLKAFSSRLPSSSCRSPGSPWKRAAGSISNSHSTPLEA